MAYPNTISRVLQSLIKRLQNPQIVARIEHLMNMARIRVKYRFLNS